MSQLKPNQLVPNLTLATIDGGTWTLHDENPQSFTLLVVYRGLHCPVCKSYLRELDQMHSDFISRGVNVIAISSDSQDRAQQTWDNWQLQNLKIGYGLSISHAKDWGLFISERINNEEPALFCEPGLFLIKPDHSLYASSVQSMPFARPALGDLMSAVVYVTENDYPARGGV